MNAVNAAVGPKVKQHKMSFEVAHFIRLSCVKPIGIGRKIRCFGFGRALRRGRFSRAFALRKKHTCNEQEKPKKLHKQVDFNYNTPKHG